VGCIWEGAFFALPFSCAVSTIFFFLGEMTQLSCVVQEKNNASLKMHLPVGSISGEKCDR